MDCPKCGTDISDSYQPAEPDVGIMGSGWYCDTCDLAVDDEDGPEPHDDDVMISSTKSDSANCQHCGSSLVPGYGMAAGGLGQYMYCEALHCGRTIIPINRGC